MSDMKRRSFVRGSVGLATGIAVAGCLGFGGDNAPPPRKAKVFENVDFSGTTMEIELHPSPEVESRAEEGQSDLGAVAASLAPVGVARAAKGAGKRGAGGYSSAPRGRHGWAVWHGGNYGDDWRDDHRDELVMYSAAIATLGFAYLGSDNAYENDPPGPGPDDVSWDRTWDDPGEGETLTVDIAEVTSGASPNEGWYRVGTELVSADGDLNFGWQAADFEVEKEGNWVMDKAWHVKPRV